MGPIGRQIIPGRNLTDRIINTFTKYGISTSRLVILDPHPVPDRNQIKEYVKLGDIYLDSFPFSGTTSLVEPLELGKPVITRQGKSFRTSMGAALLKSIHMDNLVAGSSSEYVRIATELGKENQLRRQLGERIVNEMKNKPQFLDSAMYSREVANIFRHLVN